MAMYLTALFLIAACGLGLVMRPVLRKTFGSAGVVAPGRRSEEVALQLPVELQHLPEPPVLAAASVQILEPAEVMRRLRELGLGVAELGPALPEHEQIVATALAAIGDAA